MTKEENADAVEMLNYKNKIAASTVKEIIKQSLVENLSQCIYNIYDSESSDELTKLISDDIKTRLKSLPQPRYKFVVQVLIGERREQGIR